jgi:uncharacterized membrane-anchored protein
MLTDELHARPYAVVAAPARLLHLALLTGEATADVERRCLGALCDELRIAPRRTRLPISPPAFPVSN